VTFRKKRGRKCAEIGGGKSAKKSPRGEKSTCRNQGLQSATRKKGKGAGNQTPMNHNERGGTACTQLALGQGVRLIAGGGEI